MSTSAPVTELSTARSSHKHSRFATALRVAGDAEVDNEKTFSAFDVPLPWPLLGIATVVLIVNIVMIFTGGWSTGVSTDEPTHLLRLQSYFDSGWYLPSWQLDGGNPIGSVQDLNCYGPFTSLLAHCLAVLLGIETFSEVVPRVYNYAAINASLNTYIVRHITVGMLGVMGIAAVAGIARSVFKSWGWGLLAASVLSAVPLWTGFAMFNIKDTPVATGYTLATLGLVLLSHPKVFIFRRLSYTSVTALSSGIIIAIGTRPGIWPAIAAGVLVMLFVTWWTDVKRIGSRKAILVSVMRASILLVVLLTSYLVLNAIYPKLFSNPLINMREAVISSVNYPWNLMTLSAGVVHGQPPPWWYLPVWIGNQVPFLILVCAIMGLVLTIICFSRLTIRLDSRVYSHQMGIGLLLVATQAILAPLVAVVADSVMYTGFRQLLFIVPAISLLAVAGIWLLLKCALRATLLKRWLKSGILATVSVAIVVPTYDQVRLFPYNYVYFNEIATLKPITGHWATDYWQTSLRELTPAITGEGVVVCQPGFSRDYLRQAEPVVPGYPVDYFKNCGTPVMFPFLTRGNQRNKVASHPRNPFWYVSENYFGTTIPSNCRIVDEVTRPLRGQTLVMSYVARCEMPIVEYPRQGISFLGKASGEYLLYGWSPPEEGGSWSMGEQSTIGLKLPADMRKRPLKLTLYGFRLVPKGEQRSMHVFVNNIPIGKCEFNDSNKPVPATLSVPELALASMGEGQLFIRLENPRPVTPKSAGIGEADMRPLGFFLSSLHIGGME